MNSLLSKLEEWIKEALIGGITENFQGLFDSVNEQAGSIAVQVGQTPESFNSGVFSMIRNLSDTVIVPIAGIILTIVLCYEFIQMVLERNNLHDFDTFVIFKWIFKTFCAVYILTHTFDIVMAVFDVAQYVINQSGGIISGSLDINLAMDSLADTLADMEWYASVTVDDLIAVRGLRVINGDKGLFVTMPQEKANGEYQDQFFPVMQGLRQRINEAVLEEYAAVKEKEAPSVSDQLREGAKKAKEQVPAKNEKSVSKSGPDR